MAAAATTNSSSSGAVGGGAAGGKGKGSTPYQFPFVLRHPPDHPQADQPVNRKEELLPHMPNSQDKFTIKIPNSQTFDAWKSFLGEQSQFRRWQREGRFYDIASSYNAIGVSLMQQSDRPRRYAEAWAAFKQDYVFSLQLQPPYRPEKEVIPALRKMSECAKEEGEFEQAIRYAEQALTHAVHFNLGEERQGAYVALGHVCLRWLDRAHEFTEFDSWGLSQRTKLAEQAYAYFRRAHQLAMDERKLPLSKKQGLTEEDRMEIRRRAHINLVNALREKMVMDSLQQQQTKRQKELQREKEEKWELYFSPSPSALLRTDLEGFQPSHLFDPIQSTLSSTARRYFDEAEIYIGRLQTLCIAPDAPEEPPVEPLPPGVFEIDEENDMPEGVEVENFASALHAYGLLLETAGGVYLKQALHRYVLAARRLNCLKKGARVSSELFDAMVGDQYNSLKNAMLVCVKLNDFKRAKHFAAQLLELGKRGKRQEERAARGRTLESYEYDWMEEEATDLVQWVRDMQQWHEELARIEEDMQKWSLQRDPMQYTRFDLLRQQQKVYQQILQRTNEDAQYEGYYTQQMLNTEKEMWKIIRQQRARIDPNKQAKEWRASLQREATHLISLAQSVTSLCVVHYPSSPSKSLERDICGKYWSLVREWFRVALSGRTPEWEALTLINHADSLTELRGGAVQVLTLRVQAWKKFDHASTQQRPTYPYLLKTRLDLVQLIADKYKALRDRAKNDQRLTQNMAMYTNFLQQLRAEWEEKKRTEGKEWVRINESIQDIYEGSMSFPQTSASSSAAAASPPPASASTATKTAPAVPTTSAPSTPAAKRETQIKQEVSPLTVSSPSLSKPLFATTESPNKPTQSSPSPSLPPPPLEPPSPPVSVKREAVREKEVTVKKESTALTPQKRPAPQERMSIYELLDEEEDEGVPSSNTAQNKQSQAAASPAPRSSAAPTPPTRPTMFSAASPTNPQTAAAAMTTPAAAAPSPAPAVAPTARPAALPPVSTLSVSSTSSSVIVIDDSSSASSSSPSRSSSSSSSFSPFRPRKRRRRIREDGSQSPDEEEDDDMLGDAAGPPRTSSVLPVVQEEEDQQATAERERHTASHAPSQPTAAALPMANAAAAPIYPAAYSQPAAVQPAGFSVPSYPATASVPPSASSVAPHSLLPVSVPLPAPSFFHHVIREDGREELVVAIRQLKDGGLIRSLCLARNRFHSVAVEAVKEVFAMQKGVEPSHAHIKPLCALHSLDFSFSSVDSDIRWTHILVSLPKLPQLREFNLSFTTIGGWCVDYLHRAIQKSVLLKVLRLEGCSRITGTGPKGNEAQKLAEALTSNPGMEELYLEGCRLTPIALSMLLRSIRTRLPSLRTLSLSFIRSMCFRYLTSSSSSSSSSSPVSSGMVGSSPDGPWTSLEQARQVWRERETKHSVFIQPQEGEHLKEVYRAMEEWLTQPQTQENNQIHLQLNGWSNGLDLLSHLVSILRSPCCRLRSLDLLESDLSSEQVAQLAEAIQYNLQHTHTMHSLTLRPLRAGNISVQMQELQEALQSLRPPFKLRLLPPV